MKVNMNLEDAVLLAIYHGINNPRSISEKLNVTYDDVLIAISNLEAEGLVVRKKKGIIFKKEIYELTKLGFDRAIKLKENLEEISKELKHAYESKKIEELYQIYPYLIPLLIMFGFLDEIWFNDFSSNEMDDIDIDSFDAGGGI